MWIFEFGEDVENGVAVEVVIGLCEVSLEEVGGLVVVNAVKEVVANANDG